MSYALTPIAIDLDDVAKVIGSKNLEIIDRIASTEDGSARLSDLADPDTDNPLTWREALTQLVNGGGYDSDLGHVYGYALQFLCEHLGTPLQTDVWQAVSLLWLQEIDEQLAMAGIDFSTESLILDGAPVEIPTSEYPMIGYYERQFISEILEQFSEDSLNAIEDEQVREVMMEVRDWMRQCNEKKLDLICYWS